MLAWYAEILGSMASTWSQKSPLAFLLPRDHFSLTKIMWDK